MLRLSFFQRLTGYARRHKLLLNLRQQMCANFSEVKGKMLSFQKFHQKFDVLFLGSSHMSYGINPSHFKAGVGFNFGSTSQCLMTTERLYNMIVHKACKKFDNIVVSYSVFSAGFLVMKTSERHVAVIYDYLLGIFSGNMKKEKLLYSQCKFLDKDPLNLQFQDNGYFVDPTNPGIYVDVHERAQGHLRYNKNYDSQIGCLSLIREQSLGNGQCMYVMITPVRSDYRAALPSKAELFDPLYVWADAHSVRVLDYYDAEVFNDDDFFDFDHLNEQGAQKLTSIVSAVLAG